MEPRESVENEPKDPEAMLRSALAYAGLGAQFAEIVREYVKRPDPSWRQCCDGGCIPCVDQIGLAVDYLRERGFGEGERS
ncbi:MAG TPA: hypothetical protein ENK02_10445 [Planctomycetes bacterium]|nr:hypothetical protein [Planctomycetota bacterium]